MIIHVPFASFQELGYATKGGTLYAYIQLYGYRLYSVLFSLYAASIVRRLGGGRPQPRAQNTPQQLVSNST